jgi:hypothetical protein
MRAATARNQIRHAIHFGSLVVVDVSRRHDELRRINRPIAF